MAVVAALAVAMSACASEPSQIFGDISDIAARFGDAVWNVDAEGCGWRSRGSAFAIGSRHLVTNRHVIANDVGPTVRSRDGRVELQGRVVGATPFPDLAVIRVEEDLPLTLEWAPTQSLVVEEPVVLMGYPAPSHDFAASIGQIVSFQGGGRGREAALASAFVERGNSGGPAVRADAKVAGVVTMMALASGSNERVAILFTTDFVGSTVEDYIRNPREVLSDCGLGPDYVPEVPEEFDIPQPPPPPPEDLTLTPTPRPTPTPTIRSTPSPSPTRSPTPSSTPIECPRGRPVSTVQQVETSEATAPGGPNQPSDGWWSVQITGLVQNQATAGVRLRQIDLLIGGEPPREATGFPSDQVLAPNASVQWTAGDFVRSPDGPPTRDDVEVTALRWTWLAGQFAACPTSSP